MIGPLLEFGKALLGSRPGRVLVTGLVLLALWGSFNNPATTPWYFSGLILVVMLGILLLVATRP
jgi:hypothetical protein